MIICSSQMIQRFYVGDGDGSFWLQNYASGLCLTTKNNKVSGSSKLWFKKCEGEKNKMIMETKENGAVVIYAKQKDKKFCLQTSASFAKLNEDVRWKHHEAQRNGL